jgi:hypothetical protein
MQVTQVEAQLPVLDLSPNPVTEGQVTALGKNFCGEAGCSSVTIAVEERVAASDVPVTAAGTFEVTFAVTERAGMYLVTARQTLADGRILRAEASMAVPTRDHEVSPPIDSPTLSPTSPPAPTSGASPTSTPSPSEGSPTPSGPATASSTPTSGADAGNGGDGWVLPLILALVLLAILAAVVGLWLRRSRESKTS